MRLHKYTNFRSGLAVSRDSVSIRRGFVLLTVLMLVTLGALLLTRYSLQSLRMAHRPKTTNMAALLCQLARLSIFRLSRSPNSTFRF